MVLVVKVGGSLISKANIDPILEDFSKLTGSDDVVLVHGGGPDVTEIAEKLGVEQKFIVSPSGIRSRYTDEATAEIFAMVMAGKVNSMIVARLHSYGVDAFGLSGLDGGVIIAERKRRLMIIDERGRKRAIEGGYTGRIVEVKGRILNALIDMGLTPVVSPVALGTEDEILNVDADRAAAQVAIALRAMRLVVLTDVDGLLDEGGRLVPELTLEKARDYMKKVGPGMDKKLMAAVEALDGGVDEVVIANGIKESPITKAMGGGLRTVIRR